MRTRKAKKFYARRGNLVCEGATKSEAKANLEKQIDFALAQPGIWIETRFGCVLIVAPTPTGFETKVIFPDQFSEHGKRQWCGSHYSGVDGDIKPHVLHVRTHAAQSMWDATVDDEKHVEAAGLDNTPNKRELESWIKFQRRYIAAKAQGLNDSQAFNVANGMPAPEMAS